MSIPISLGMLPPMLVGIALFGANVMNLEQWKEKNNKCRRYAHFDVRVNMKSVWSYISDPKRVERHGFYPFIHYEKRLDKFDKNTGRCKKKTRHIFYSAHMDRYILQYYGYKLNQEYNRRVIIDGINDVAIAYRTNLHKNNIHFAKQAIDFIRATGQGYVVIGDFTEFFDSLDHTYLKTMLKDLLGVHTLPNDYYAIYKNIIHFSYWERDHLLEVNGLPQTRRGAETLNRQDRVLSPEQFKQLKKEHVHSGRENDKGIPQGSAISAVFSNIYMLEFDKTMNDYVQSTKGLYLRYSDDFILVFPHMAREEFSTHLCTIHELINSIPNLVLQPDKTKVFEFNGSTLLSRNSDFFEDVCNDSNMLNYLGFAFDGNIVTIRDKTLSKYYYRMYRKIHGITACNGKTKSGKRIPLHTLYKKYSRKGKRNFITYAKRAESIFGPGEGISRGTKRHMQKIKRKLRP